MTARRFAISAWVLASVLLGVLSVSHTSGYFFNTTESLPRGIWRALGAPVLQDGRYVTATLPDTAAIAQLRQWGYMDRRRLLKPIGAVPGDVVTVSSEGLHVNGRLLANSLQLIHDGPGHVLPRMAPGRYVVAPGTVWLISQYNPISLDSRYFGPVPVTDLINEATPVLVHRGQPGDEAAALAAVRQMIQTQYASTGSGYIETDLGARHDH